MYYRFDLSWLTLDCNNVEYVSRLRSCVEYSVNLTAFQRPEQDSEVEEYNQLIVTTTESSKFYFSKIQCFRFSLFSLNFSEPSSPQGLQVIEKNSTSMKVSWELPTENRECVHHYR